MTLKDHSQASSLSIDKFKNKEDILKPASDATKRQYMDIYYEYAQGSLTYRQVAEKHGMSLDHVAKIVKWAVITLRKNVDLDAYKQSMEDKLKHRIQRLENEYLIKAEKEGTKAAMLVWKEIRMNDRLLAEVQSLKSFKDGDPSKVQVNVQINQLNRRTGDADSNTSSEGE